VLLHDWDRHARPAMREETAVLLAGDRETAPAG
jgi:hypothetical protein